jgi:uncharacterized membrane-anchored protein
MRLPRTRRTWFVVLVLSQVVVLLGMVTMRDRTLPRPAEVVLEVTPFDDDAPDSGAYVTLGYEIGRVRMRDRGIDQGDDVVVALEERDGVARATGVWRRADDAPRGPFIRGWADEVRGRHANVSYGIENLYVTERLERSLGSSDPGKAPQARVRLDEHGRARLCELGDEPTGDC